MKAKGLLFMILAGLLAGCVKTYGSAGGNSGPRMDHGVPPPEDLIRTENRTENN